MPRYYVTHDGPLGLAPLTRGGTFRVWDEIRAEPIRELHWFESRGAPLLPPDRTLSEAEARKEAYDLTRELNAKIESADAYRRRK
ncbi:hypothetical protein BCY88_09960 [Paraburkholderia fungorum]|uniref:Uncharacterized protein n=1 Tax=Paraburkholderia fungorum TaxID=134537 RepID=A0A3R7HK35_9BURK|nr:hypothetical protein BCY88_09960 [Paraburkholderia fungorum]